MNNLEIFCTARLVIAQQGSDAASHYARERTRLSEARADQATADTWERIENAIQQILIVGAESILH